ncbi:hypothetical protein [Pedobacter sp. V48]|uniref:hypothetical protein n=1 Tax=Pedobacter sp. V48 TaxID=509635 RepID=UPI0003E55882|nr:hypothetical protein [Pedobacter sp. V48]ETZ22797.1 hypothetical protein N824_21135 [Pedobacter sp. V48]
MKALTAVFSFLILFSICFTSCEKDREAPSESALVGDWQELDLTGFVRSVKFTNKNEFQFSTGNNEGYATKYTGTYQILSDSLKIETKEMLSQDPGKPAVKTATTFELYEKATFSISGDILTLKYITYPADAPVTTTAKFRKAITIDQGGLIK